MRLRSWMLLMAGLVLSALTGLALYGVAQQAEARPTPPPAAETVSVVVAKVDIPVRTVVTGEMLARRDVPKNLVPTGAISSEPEAIGQTTLAAKPNGSFILRADLAAVGGKTGASVTIEKGKVLVAFPTSDPLTAAGLVTVGDRIDLLATITSGTGETAKKTQTIVQNLEVVEILGPTKEQPGRPTSLTFIVDHQTALFLKYLRDSQAAVDVVVRSRAETETVETTSVNLPLLQERFKIR